MEKGKLKMLAHTKQAILMTLSLLQKTYPYRSRYLRDTASHVLAADTLDRLNACLIEFVRSPHMLMEIQNTFNQLLHDVTAEFRGHYMACNVSSPLNDINSELIHSRGIINNIIDQLDREDLAAFARTSTFFRDSVRRSGVLNRFNRKESNSYYRLKPDQKNIAVLNDYLLSAVQVFPNGDLLVSSEYQAVYILSMGDDGEYAIRQVLTGHLNRVNDVLILSDDEIVSAGDEDDLIVWRRNKDKMFENFCVLNNHRIHNESVRRLAKIDSHSFASASTRGTILIWRRGADDGYDATNDNLAVTGSHQLTTRINALLGLSSGMLVAACNDGIVNMWRYNDSTAKFDNLQTLHSPSSSINVMAEYKNGEIVCGFDNGDVRKIVLDSAINQYFFDAVFHSEEATISVVTPISNNKLMCVSADGVMSIHESQKNKSFRLIMRDTSLPSGISQIEQTPDDRYVYVKKRRAGFGVLAFPRLFHRIRNESCEPYNQARTILKEYISKNWLQFSLVHFQAYLEQQGTIRRILWEANSFSDIQRGINALNPSSDHIITLKMNINEIMPLLDMEHDSGQRMLLSNRADNIYNNPQYD